MQKVVAEKQFRVLQHDLCNEKLLFSQISTMIKIPDQKMSLQIN